MVQTLVTGLVSLVTVGVTIAVRTVSGPNFRHGVVFLVTVGAAISVREQSVALTPVTG